MPYSDRPKPLSLWKRQAAACAAFGLLLALIMAALYLQHRQREWMHRCEQAQHRLDLAYELISREIARVAADAMYLANRPAVGQFASGATARRSELLDDFMLFVQQKALYDQVRLLDLQGHETIRINFTGAQAASVSEESLQDKSNRVYFREGKSLRPGELFVSEFDLNQEHRKVETPHKPVIRFVAPVVGDAGQPAGLLVLNYLGAELLRELTEPTLPGHTVLLRRDGHYIRAPDPRDDWGWLLGRKQTFAVQFPDEWRSLSRFATPRLTGRGLFVVKSIPLGRIASPQPVVPADATPADRAAPPTFIRDSITIVSYLPRETVYAASNELLGRFLILGGSVFALAIVFSRPWARATLTRQHQAARIAASEKRLRELSSRLLRIQEDERRAISREIHDQLGQQATAVNLDLKLAQRKIDNAEALPHLQRAIQENETLLGTLHEFAKRVRPALLDDLGLRDAVESHLEDFQQRTGVQVESQLDFPEDRIPSNVADNSFRIVQESLNNVAKHADAARVSVILAIGGPQHDQFEISISDDGRGHPGSVNGRLGLIGMQERVDLLGGEIDLTSQQDVGTHIKIRLPLPPRA